MCVLVWEYFKKANPYDKNNFLSSVSLSLPTVTSRQCWPNAFCCFSCLFVKLDLEAFHISQHTVIFLVVNNLPSCSVLVLILLCPISNPMPSPYLLFFCLHYLQPWRMTVSRWCSSRSALCASRWQMSVSWMKAATSVSSTQMLRTTRWPHCQFWCRPRCQRSRWSRKQWKATTWSLPVFPQGASLLLACDGFATAEKFQVPGHGS